jgi:hypothetical protein
MKINITLLAIALVIGIVLGYMLSPSPKISETIVTNIDTVLVKDTIFVDVVKPIIMESVPDVISEDDNSGLVKSTKTFEMENFDVRVDAYAKCPVKLFEIELLNIKPMQVEIEKEIVTIEKIKTVVIEPAWYATNTAGIIYGVAGTLALVYATGQLLGK